MARLASWMTLSGNVPERKEVTKRASARVGLMRSPAVTEVNQVFSTIDSLYCATQHTKGTSAQIIGDRLLLQMSPKLAQAPNGATRPSTLRANAINSRRASQPVPAAFSY